MQRFTKIPLIFLFIASLLGVFLRWQFISPTSGINYTFLLHGHSHVMFLGWVFNALFIGFVSNHVPESEQRSFKYIFIFLQILVAGMLVSFPLQGYDFFSILFSTLHTLIAIFFVVKFFNKTKYVTSISVRFARAALIFFVISAIGPFSLGYTMSAGLGQTERYYNSIYFYLHFQYNGFFLFGIFSLFFDQLEKRHIQFSAAKSKSFGMLLAIACVPAYFLSTLWARPGHAYNVAGGAAALAQLVAFAILIHLVISIRREFKFAFDRTSIYFSLIVLICFAAKLLLQLVSALPSIAQMAYELRPVTIAYLHLVLVGVISLFVLIWYLESDFIDRTLGIKAIYLFLFSFIGMEACLAFYPWWPKLLARNFPSSAISTFFFSLLLSLSFLIFVASAYRKEADKNQSFT